MKSFSWQIIFKNTILLAVFFFCIAFVASYLIQKKEETYIEKNIEYIRDAKFKSLNKDNLQTAFDFQNLIYTTYVIDETGKTIFGNGFSVDNEVINLCKASLDASSKYAKNGSTKYISVKKNVNLCFVVESNTNNSVIFGQFVQQILLSIFGFLTLILCFLLYRTKRKISKPVKILTDNAESALVGKFDNIKNTNSKILEIQNLEKYSRYVSDLLKEKMNAGMTTEAMQSKDLQANFIKEKSLLEVNRFKLALDSANEIIAIMDKNLYINYFNKFTSHYSGIDFKNAEGKKITQLWHEESEEKLWKDKIEEILITKKPVSFTSIGLKKDKIKFESVTNISPILTAKGEVDYLLVIERDVSEDKQRERTKSEFISVVSHELRTPMTVIRGYASLLGEGKLGELNTKQHEYVEKISEETTRLLDMANDMLDLQKFDANKIILNLEKTDVVTFLKDEIKEFIPLYTKKNLYLKVDNESTNSFATFDKRYMHRAISNLLSNAIKFTEEGGVTIYVINPDEENVVIAVKDTGEGINESALPHLFDKFYQASNVLNRKVEGSGLGLSIVKKVVDAHHALVWVESKEKEGTTFYIALSVN